MYWPFLLAIWMLLYALLALTNVTVVFINVIMGVLAFLIALLILFSWRSHWPNPPG